MKVYLLSTLNDLALERGAVYEALKGDREIHVVDSYTADERSVGESCLDEVAGCDLYIGIIGRRYEFIPPGQTNSITELEYEKARECKLPTLVFIKKDTAITLPSSDTGTREYESRLIDSFSCKVQRTEKVS